MGRKLLFGVVCEKAYAENVSGIIKGMIAQAFRINCDIAVLSTLQGESSKESRYTDSEMNLFKLVMSERFDGFLYISRSFGSEKRRAQTEQLLMRTGKPVMIAGGTEHNIFDNTAPNERRPFERITDHLIDVHGCRVIYFLSGAKGDNSYEEKISGFCDSMKRHGLYYDRNSFIYGDVSSGHIDRFTDDLIRGKKKRPDAVVCGDNALAAALISALAVKGISVPDDIAVTGADFSDSQPASFINITSYKRDDQQLGADSVRRLYRIITGNTAARISENTDGLHTGTSCGCSPFGNMDLRKSRHQFISEKYSRELSVPSIAMECMNEKDLEEALVRFCGYSRYIYKYSWFDICLSADYTDSSGSVSRTGMHTDHRSEMIRYITSSASGKITVSEQKFRAVDIHPELKKKDRRPMALFVNLLRNGSDEYGYTVLSFGKNCETFAEGYVSFIYELNLILARFASFSYSSYFSGESDSASYSLFPNVNIFERKRRQNADTLITVEIQSIRRLFLEKDRTDLRSAVTEFEEILMKSLESSEKCAIVTNGLYAVLSERPARTRQIYREMRSRDISSLFGKEHRIVISCAEIKSSEYDLSEAVRRSLLNERSGFVIDGSVTPNPLYEKLCMIRERMQIYPQQEWSIESISRELGISKSYLQKYYRANFGMSIIDSLIHIRLEAAKKLLRETDLTVTAIAEKCGYSSYIHFTKQFRKAENTTPTNYRMKYRAEVDI